MSSKEIVEKYLEYFKNKGHKLIPNVSLVPEGDPTLLFVNSGMFPLVPYLSGEIHPMGNRLMNIQRSMRFNDLEEVGDNRHTTVFHMLGNWSLGDYFKQEQLTWAYNFFIEKLGLAPERLFASVFEGNKHAPRDTESIQIIQQIFKQYNLEAKEGKRIFSYNAVENWWQRGKAIGELGGPDSEIFYYTGKGSGIGKNPAEYQNEFIEIGNNVFMQYKRTPAGWAELPQKNVDFGGGLERIAMVVEQKQDIFETDNFYPIIQELEKLSNKKYGETEQITRAMRIVADHIRSAVLLAMDGILPSNKDQGYALRRFIRRLVRFGHKLGIENNLSTELVQVVSTMLGWLYPELDKQTSSIKKLFAEEEERFKNTLRRAEKQVNKYLKGLKAQPLAVAKAAFDLFQSTGFPPEMFLEEAREQGINLNTKEFEKAYQDQFNKHQDLSRQGASTKFKGGLADNSEEVIKYHTTTHLLHQALRIVLGNAVQQSGSNITKSRLRFDFIYDTKLTDQEINHVEDLINKTISQKLPVGFVILEKEKAEQSGALHFFKEKYADKVKVYYIGRNLEKAFSKEFCGGPHIKTLAELSPSFRIYKQEAVGKGTRRIYARFNY